MDGDVTMSGRARTAKIALMLAMAFLGSVTAFAVGEPVRLVAEPVDRQQSRIRS